MLVTILRTPVFEEISIQIMDAFVAMRKYLASNNYENRISNIETKLIDYDNKFDDRFIIIDDKVLYYCGASFKDLGKKCFALNLIEEAEILKI